MFSRLHRFVIAAFFYPLAALYAWVFASLRMARPMWEPATFARMVDGTALTPFQYRVLIPWTVGRLRDIPVLADVPLDAFRFAGEFLFTFLLLITFRAYVGCIIRDSLRRKGRIEQKSAKDAKICSGQAAPRDVARRGLAGATWRSLRPSVQSLFAVLLLAWALPFHYLLPRLEQLGLYYVYDIPAVFFFTLGLLLLYQRRWLLFYPVFLLATFNRETTCFLTLIYLFTALPPVLLQKRLECKSRCKRKWPQILSPRTPTPTFTLKSSPDSPETLEQSQPVANQRINESLPPARINHQSSPIPHSPSPINHLPSTISPIFFHCLAQLTLWIAVKWSLSALYGGSLHEWHYARNFYLLRVPSTYAILATAFGFLWLPVLFGYRRIGNDFLRRSVWAVPVYFAGMFVVAQLYELRQYGEMIPVVLAAVCFLVVRASNAVGPDSDRDQPARGPCRSRDLQTAHGRVTRVHDALSS